MGSSDVYGRPRVDLRGVDCAVVRQDLNKWRKQKKNLPSVSLAELSRWSCRSCPPRR